MFAVIATGGKQYPVRPGDVIKVELLKAEPGEKVIFDQVLLAGEPGQVEIGTPYLSNMTVQGEVVSIGRGKKIEIIKLRRRKHYLRHAGHRQNYTEVKILSIGDVKPVAKPPKAAKKVAEPVVEASESEVTKTEVPKIKKTAAAKKPPASVKTEVPKAPRKPRAKKEAE